MYPFSLSYRDKLLKVLVLIRSWQVSHFFVQIAEVVK